MKKDIVLTANEIEKMTPNKVDKLVEQKTKEILENIQNCTNKIQEAKEAAEYAESMDVGRFWGRGKRTAAKAEATAEALMNTNEAVSELSKVVKESIAFTCLSMAFAQKMTESIAKMMAEGFEDSNGNYISLSNDAKEQGEIILKQAKSYLNSQLQINELEQKQKIKDELDKVQSEKIEVLENKLKEKDSLDSKQDELILKNTERLNKKDEIDELQTQRLEELGALLNNKDLIDSKQEEAIEKNAEAIKVLFEYTKQKDEIDKKQSEEIEKILKTKNKNVLSILSLIISLCSIGLWIFMFIKIY